MKLWKVDVGGGSADYHVVARSAEEAVQAIFDVEGKDAESWDLEAFEAPEDQLVEIRWESDPGRLILDSDGHAKMPPRGWLKWHAGGPCPDKPLVLCCSEW